MSSRLKVGRLPTTGVGRGLLIYEFSRDAVLCPKLFGCGEGCCIFGRGGGHSHLTTSRTQFEHIGCSSLHCLTGQ